MKRGNSTKFQEKKRHNLPHLRPLFKKWNKSNKFDTHVYFFVWFFVCLLPFCVRPPSVTFWLEKKERALLELSFLFLACPRERPPFHHAWLALASALLPFPPLSPSRPIRSQPSFPLGFWGVKPPLHSYYITWTSARISPLWFQNGEWPPFFI